MKILLLGQSGQVGWELQRSLAVLGQVVALGRDNHEYCGNVSDPGGGGYSARIPFISGLTFTPGCPATEAPKDVKSFIFCAKQTGVASSFDQLS